MTLLNHEPQQSLSLSISLPFSLVSWFPVEAGWWCGDERSLVAPPPHSGPPQLHSSLPKLVPKTCSPAQQPGPLPWGHSGATPGGPTHPVWFSALQPVFLFLSYFSGPFVFSSLLLPLALVSCLPAPPLTAPILHMLSQQGPVSPAQEQKHTKPRGAHLQNHWQVFYIVLHCFLSPVLQIVFEKLWSPVPLQTRLSGRSWGCCSF